MLHVLSTKFCVIIRAALVAYALVFVYSFFRKKSFLLHGGLTPRGYSQYLLQGQYLKNHSFFCPYLLKLTMINIQGLLHMKVRQSLSNG